VVPQLEAAADSLSSAIQVIADATTADLPTRVWLNEAAEHAGKGARALSRAWENSADVSEVSSIQGSGAAQQVSEAAARLLADVSSKPFAEDDLKALVPLVGEAVDNVSTGCSCLANLYLPDLGLGALDVDGALTEAMEQLDECSARLSDAQDGLVKAARDNRVAVAVEAAWAAGAAHGSAGYPLAIADGRAGSAPSDADSEALAASLGLEPEPAAAVVTTYRDAYAEAANKPGGAAVTRGRYVPGQEITTALGRTGILTGDAGPGDRPRVRFGDDQEETVPREAIRAPLAHVLAEMPGAEDIIPCVADGDVVLVTSVKIVPWVQTADGLRPACGDTASLGRRQCEYEDSVRMAEEAMGLAPGSLFELDQYASPFDDTRYSGHPFPGWTRREIEKQWGRPPGSMRAFDYGTESHLDRLASELARLEFPSPPSLTPPPGRLRQGPAPGGRSAIQSTSPGR
jgi:hypothetical protein